MNSSKLVTRCPFGKPDDPKQHLSIGAMVGRTNSLGSSSFTYQGCKVPQFHRLGFPRCRKSLDSENVEVYRDPRRRRQFSWWTSEKSRNGNVPASSQDKLVSPPEVDFCARVPEQHPSLDSNSGTMSTSSPTLSYASVLKRPGEPVKQEVPKNGCRSTAEMSKSCGMLTALLKSGQDDAAASEAKSPEASQRKAQKARCSRFSDLKELLGAADLPREPPAAVASPLLSCLVGGLNYGILPSPVKLIEGATLSPKSPLRVDCGNTLIAFIMGTGVDEDSCDEEEDDGDWDVWETQGPSSPVVPEKALAVEVIVEFCEEGVPETVAVDTPDGSCVENGSEKCEKNPRSLDEVNRRWKLAYDSVQTSATKKLVHFAADDRLTVCHEVEWIERKGPWEQMARDKERFKKRIEEASLVIGPVLEAQHRSKVCRDRIPQQHCSDNDACLSGFRDATVG